MIKQTLWVGLCLSLIGCKAINKPYESHGPIKVTIKKSAAVDEPFFIQSAHVKTCDDKGCQPVSSDNGYRNLKSTYINIPVVFPREKLQLAQAGTKATIAFSIYHPRYAHSITEASFSPTDESDMSRLTIDAEYFEELLTRLEAKANEGQEKMAKVWYKKERKEYQEGRKIYLNARYQLGAAINEHIRMMREVYLPQFIPEDQTKIIEKYNPKIKKWFYRYPETNCEQQQHCEQDAQKPRTKHFNGL